MMRFRHNDLDHFERCLENCPPEDEFFIVSEGVFSMEGDIADLRGIHPHREAVRRPHFCRRSPRHRRAWETGAGASEHLGVLDDVDIIMGTFSKSLASVGGFIAGEKTVIDFLKHTARAVCFLRQSAARFGSRGRRSPAIIRRNRSAAGICCASPDCCARTALPRLYRAATAKRPLCRW